VRKIEAISSFNIHAPQVKPGISTLRTASSSFFMSVSSSHGLTSSRMEDLPPVKISLNKFQTVQAR